MQKVWRRDSYKAFNINFFEVNALKSWRLPSYIHSSLHIYALNTACMKQNAMLDIHECSFSIRSQKIEYSWIFSACVNAPCRYTGKRESVYSTVTNELIFLFLYCAINSNIHKQNFVSKMCNHGIWLVSASRFYCDFGCNFRLLMDVNERIVMNVLMCMCSYYTRNFSTRVHILQKIKIAAKIGSVNGPYLYRITFKLSLLFGQVVQILLKF